MNLAQILVLLVALQRVAELVYARRNTRRLLAAGAFEVGAGHYPLVVALHAAWLLSMFLLVPPDAPVSWPLLALYGLLQIARLWTLHSLGARWTTRIVIPPDRALVTHGPYRWARHPNYMIVAAEIALLPAAFGAWALALVFSLLNAGVLAWRIRLEDRALAALRG